MPLTKEYLATLDKNIKLEVILAEREKCAKDPYYTITNYFELVDPANGEVELFSMYPYQKRATQDFEENDNCITMKTRQTGLTTIAAAYAAWFMATRRKVIVNALAQDKKRSKKFLKSVRDFLDGARKRAPWLIPIYSDSNNGKEEFALTNLSLISAEANKPDACRGETINLLVIDEVAAISWMEDIWASAGLTLTRSRGKCIAISCVTEDTYLFTDEGPKQIKELFPLGIKKTLKQDLEIESYKVSGNNKILRESNLLHCNGLSKTYKLKTRYSELEGSSKHKLWAYSNKEERFDWYMLENLQKDDWVRYESKEGYWGNKNEVNYFPEVSSFHTNKFSCEKLTPELCYFLGLYIAEGSIYETKIEDKIVGKTVTISCGDDVSFALDNLGLRYTYVPKDINYEVHSSTLVDFMYFLGFKRMKAVNKEIPKRLFSMSKENISALLSGIFDGDGTADKSEGRVTLTSTSKSLIEQVRVLLQNYGILSHVYCVPKEQMNSYNTKYKAKSKEFKEIKFNYDTYNLEIYSQYAKKFYENIGFKLERKQKNKSSLSINPLLGQVPNSSSILRTLISTWTKSKLRLFRESKINIDTYKSGYGKKTLLRLCKFLLLNRNLCNNYELVEKIYDEVLQEDSEWVQIKNIEQSENYTYDVSLPSTEDKWCHSVVYNGILGHQTPKGQSGWYFDQYTNAEELAWKVIDAHWSEHPIYKLGMYQWIKDDDNLEGGYIKYFNEDWPDMSFKGNVKKYGKKETYRYILDGKLRSPWYDYESKKLGKRLTKCELDCSFSGSGGEVLDSDVIRTISLKAKEYKQLNQPLKGIWASYREYILYNPLHNYIVSCDTMTGDGSDYSAFVVVDTTTREVCATFKDRLEQKVYAKIINDVGLRYGTALVIIENQNGLTCLHEIKDKYRYPNLYYSTLKLRQIEKKERKRKLGFWQSEATRKLGGDKLEEFLISGELKIPCMNIVNELHTWIWNRRGKRDHAEGKHDDLLMSLTMAMFHMEYTMPKSASNNKLARDNFEFQRKIIVIRNDLGMEDIFNDILDEQPDENGEILPGDFLSQKQNYDRVSKRTAAIFTS